MRRTRPASSWGATKPASATAPRCLPRLLHTLALRPYWGLNTVAPMLAVPRRFILGQVTSDTTSPNLRIELFPGFPHIIKDVNGYIGPAGNSLVPIRRCTDPVWDV